jgi:hypothetical protein
MSVTTRRAEAESLFAYARRVLSGTEEAPAAPVEPIDIRSGIDRALRHTRRAPATPKTTEEAAARAVSAVEGTLVAIDSIHDYLREALDLAASAMAAPDATKRAMIADRYEELRSRIDTVAAGATFEGVNLIDAGRDSIEVKLPAAGEPRHSIGHITLVAGERGLSLKAPSELFSSNDEVEITRTSLMAARERLNKAAETFLNQASVLAPHMGLAATA